MTITSCLDRPSQFISGDSEISLPPGALIARAVEGATRVLPSVILGGGGAMVSVVAYSPPDRVTELPSGDVIVPAIVASAMRALGQRHTGRVYTPQMLVGGKSPGLILHEDISTLTIAE